jgi:integrase/recombinase XerD
MTLDWHRNTIRYFVRYLVAEGLPATVADGLTPGNVRAWLDAQREGGLAQRTLATRVQSLKAFSKWLCEEDYLPKDPLAKLKPPKFDDVAKETLTPDEVDRLLQACVHHNRQHVTGLRDRAIILLLYSTGLRSAELVNLQESDLDWDRGLLLVRRGKGGKFRQVPLAGKAARARPLPKTQGTAPRPARLPNHNGRTANPKRLSPNVEAVRRVDGDSLQPA